jgi:hypothetical protein
MKAYLVTTGAVFGLLTLVHIWRAVVESTLRDPAFSLVTIISAALCVWALSLLRRGGPGSV